MNVEGGGHYLRAVNDGARTVYESVCPFAVRPSTCPKTSANSCGSITKNLSSISKNFDSQCLLPFHTKRSDFDLFFKCFPKCWQNGLKGMNWTRRRSNFFLTTCTYKS